MSWRKTAILLCMLGACWVGVMVFLGKGRGVSIAYRTMPSLEFRLETYGVSQIDYITYYSLSKKEYLWHFINDEQPLKHWTYGKIPKGVRQLYPLSGKHPRVIGEDEEILVIVSFSYVDAYDIAVTSKAFYFRLKNTDQFINLTELPSTGPIGQIPTEEHREEEVNPRVNKEREDVRHP
jgi:hypothetical protein